MIDVHVLTLPERFGFLTECLQSLEDQSINIHVVGGIKGHIGKGRVLGYSKGESEWVSFVDDDDLAEPQAYQKILNAMSKFPSADAILTHESRIDESGHQISRKYKRPNMSEPYLFNGDIARSNHIMVFRRNLIEQFFPVFLNTPSGGDFLVRSLYCKDKASVMIPENLYRWRFTKNDKNREWRIRK